jgi:flagellar L-ring protein precursor FlgH
MSRSLIILIVIFLVIVFVLLPYGVKSEQLTGLVSNSLYTDHKAHQVGDLLTVLIYENAQGSNVSESNNKKDNKFEASGTEGLGALKFIPLLGASTETKNETKGSGETVRSGNLIAKMTVTVMTVRENGDLVIEGNRIIGVNQDKEMMTLSGVVRPQDITGENTVYSYNIADAKIIYQGKGPSSSSSRPGIFSRIINWIF